MAICLANSLPIGSTLMDRYTIVKLINLEISYAIYEVADKVNNGRHFTLKVRDSLMTILKSYINAIEDFSTNLAHL